MGLFSGLGGALIGGATSLLGGLMGAKSARDNTQDSIAWQRENAAQSTALQREFAQNGIRWRVEDAKAAGLHPLYALGGAGATYTPTASSVNFDNGGQALAKGISDMGQSVAGAISRQETADQRAMRLLQMDEIRSRIRENDARADALRSQATGLGRGQQTPTMPDGISAIPYPVSAPISAADLYARPLADAIEMEPRKITSSRSNDRSTTAGVSPWFDEHEITSSGMKFRMPRSNEPGETWAEMPWYQKAFYMWKNAMDSGNAPDWIKNWIMEYALGKQRGYRTTDPAWADTRYGQSSRRYGVDRRPPQLK